MRSCRCRAVVSSIVILLLVPLAAARARVGVLVEIGFDQGDLVRAIFEEAGLLEVEVLQDLGGRDRVVRGRVAG